MKIILSIFIFMISISGYASTTGVTTISQVMLDQTNGVKVYFKVAENLPTEDGCRTNPNWPFVIDISTEFGKSLYSAVLAAYMAKSDVQVFGFGTCDVHNAVETVRRIEFE